MRHIPLLRSLKYLVLALALAMAGCDATKNTPTGAADAFFALMAKGKYTEAYRSASFAFQVPTNEVAFTAMAKDLKLGEFPGRNWTVKSSTDKDATLDGDLTDANGNKAALQVLVTKQAGQWKIYSIHTPAEGSSHLVDRFNTIGHGQSFNDAFARKVPTDDEVRALVDDTILQFNNGLHKKNFSDFYANTSALWRSETSKEKVERAFSSFVEAGVNIDNYKDTKAVFEEPPRLNGEGMLLVRGYYPSKPNRVIFDLRYTYELPKWKLLGITISIKP